MKYLLFLCMVLVLCNCSGEVVIATDESSSGNESSSFALSSIYSDSSQESSSSITMSSESGLDESSENVYIESSVSNKEVSSVTQSESSSLNELSTNTLSSSKLSSEIEQKSSMEYSSSSSSMVVSSSQGLVYPYVHKSLYKKVSTSEKVVALTFDDGPDFEAGSTEAFLQFFQEQDMKVTFFHIGQNAEAAPDKVWRVLEEGHQIGNHSMTHGHIIEKDIAGVEYEIKGFQNYYAETFRYTPTVFRAPFLEINDPMWNLLQTLSLPPIDAIVDIVDWGDQPAGEIKARLENQIAPGVIVLCHERMKTLDVLKESIDDLKSQGYQFVTLNELLEYQ